ncbi:MAG: enoyl-CoA hydratase/isomerase family protein [Pseudomonadota bacterium]
MSDVLYEISDGRAAITLNRPARLNAINRDMLFGLEEALKRANHTPSVQVVLLAGAGAAFCAGDDLAELAKSPPGEADAADFIERLQNITRLIMLGDKVVVCAVRGWAIGGGASWPFNADIALWSDTARIRFPEARHGLFSSGGATMLLERFAGPHRASEILMLGGTYDAAALAGSGLALKITPDAELDAEADALVEKLLSLRSTSLVRCKRARAGLVKSSLEQALSIESRMMLDAVRALIESGVMPAIDRA